MATEENLDSIDLALKISKIFDRLQIHHLIGGSIASSLLGEFRYTNDIDFVAQLLPEHLDPFMQILGEKYYVSREAAQLAIAKGESFNLIHIPSVQKVDIFASERTEFGREQMSRRILLNVREGSQLPIASAEDIVLMKLHWYKKGGCVSDRQWSDIRGVLKVQKVSIDLSYVRRWAPVLGVAELAEKAIDFA